METFLNGPWVYVVIGILFVFAILAAIVVKLDSDNKKYQAISDARQAKEAYHQNERERVANLPKLNKRWLMAHRPISQVINDVWVKRSFRVVDARVMVIDENHGAWIGFCMPETLESLMAAEYIQDGGSIGCRGPNRNKDDAPVKIGDHTTYFYPNWLNPEHTDTLEWSRWVELEKAFSSLFRGLGQGQEAFDKIVTTELLKKFKANRKSFPELY